MWDELREPREVTSAPCPAAHTPAEGRSGEFHAFADHARSVADLAAIFAEPFGGASLARILGMTHDAGKLTVAVQSALQRRAREKSRQSLGQPHKAEGAALAGSLISDPDLSALAIAINYGHHTGMPDFVGAYDGYTLSQRDVGASYLDSLRVLLDELLSVDLRALGTGVDVPPYVGTPESKTKTELFGRMCHSALVDADFLDTETHFAGGTSPRRTAHRGMKTLCDEFMTAYHVQHDGAPDSELNSLRRGIFESCREVARRPIGGRGGLYRLPAQTGSGKTLAAAAFALEHAVAFGKRRVVIAVPFTSITTQNAEVYRRMFVDSDVVLEHHSDITDEHDDVWRRLSTQNWDAEFIVTTTVQLFESLFANNPASTRKLHRLVNSVLVLDEVQALPLQLVPSLLRMLRDLAEGFGVTVLLASATQPAFWSLPVFEGFESIDVVPVDSVPDVTRRVGYEVRSKSQTLAEIADEVAELDQVLVIVNTTANAQEVYRQLQIRGVEPLHLSTRMCGAHRLVVLEEVRRRLVAGEPVGLVSTQVIEAGVDVDFPVVYRALAPADSVVQAAGRCNREGRLGLGGGRVVVFDPSDGGSPPGDYRNAAGLTRQIFIDEALRADLPVIFGEPQAMADYYRRLYASTFNRYAENKSTKIDGHRADCNYASVDQEFKMIEADTVPVVVATYGPESDAVNAAIDRLRDPSQFVDRETRRLLHRHTVQLRRGSAQPELMDEFSPGMFVWIGDYDPGCGVIYEAGVSSW